MEDWAFWVLKFWNGIVPGDGHEILPENLE